MGKFIDLVGERFSRLSVKSRSENSGTRAMWQCICDCGEYVIVSGKNLRTLHTKSCGCMRLDISCVAASKKNILTTSDIHNLLSPRDIVMTSEYVGTMSPAAFKCICGTCWVVALAGSVLHTSGCPSCSKRMNGFIGKEFFTKNPHLVNSPASLYIIKLTSIDEIFFKVGITRQIRIEDRLRKIPYEYEIINIINGTLFDIFDLEKQIKKSNIAIRYSPKHNFNGKSECFTSIPILHQNI
jgi:hypothetical protein